jgi:hypothetical protein
MGYEYHVRFNRYRGYARCVDAAYIKTIPKQNQFKAIETQTDSNRQRGLANHSMARGKDQAQPDVL